MILLISFKIKLNKKRLNYEKKKGIIRYPKHKMAKNPKLYF